MGDISEYDLLTLEISEESIQISPRFGVRLTTRFAQRHYGPQWIKIMVSERMMLSDAATTKYLSWMNPEAG